MIIFHNDRFCYYYFPAIIKLFRPNVPKTCIIGKLKYWKIIIIFSILIFDHTNYYYYQFTTKLVLTHADEPFLSMQVATKVGLRAIFQ